MTEYTRLTPEQGFHVYGWMRTELGLSGTELAIYAIVYSYTRNGGAIGGIRFFSEWTGASKPTVINTLQKLEQAGLILATETGNGKLKKYTIPDGEPVKNFNQSKNLTSKETLPLPVKNFNHHQSENLTSTSKDFLPATKIERELDNKIERKLENAREEMPPLAQRAMQTATAPTFEEVYSTMRSLIIRPDGADLDQCAHAFYEREAAQGWSGNWKGKISRYAASWLNNINRSGSYMRKPQKQHPRGCQPDDPRVDHGEIPW